MRLLKRSKENETLKIDGSCERFAKSWQEKNQSSQHTVRSHVECKKLQKKNCNSRHQAV